MISKLSLHNFQSHKATELDLHPGVNVIIGSSDSGKSAIIRGLRWLVWNKPGGDGFRSTWGGETKVEVDLEWMRVARLRSNKTNAYSIYEPGESADTPPQEADFKAFGAEPPEEVTRILKLDEVNLQQQLARPFLLDSSPGQVAQYLNGVARLDSIDTALSRVGKWIRALDGDIRAKKQRIEDLEQEAGRYIYLPDMELAVEGIERTEAELRSTRDKLQTLRACVQKLQRIEAQASELQRLADLQSLVAAALAKYDEFKSLKTERDRVSSLVKRCRDIDDDLQSLASLKRLKPAVEHLVELRERINTKRAAIAKLAGVIDRIQRNDEERQKAASLAKELHIRFDREMGEKCMLCGSKL